MATGDVTFKWGTEGVEVTWASGGPDGGTADGAFTSLSDEVDLNAALVLDQLISAKITAGSSPGSDAFVQLYAVSPADGTNYPGNTDNYIPLGRPFLITGTSANYSPQFSLAEAFGGVLPRRYKIAVENQTGVALSSTADSSEVYRQNVFANVAA